MPLSRLKKNSSYFIILLNLGAILNLCAQDKPSVEKNQFKIDILAPGFVYEHGLSAKNTLHSELSVGLGYRYDSYFGSTCDFYPLINEQVRHYYNLEKRVAKGKVTARNSGNFVAMAAFYNFKSFTTNDSFYSSNSSITFAPLWGYQRTNERNFNLDVNMGIGYNIGKHDNSFVPVFSFTLGWVIGK